MRVSLLQLFHIRHKTATFWQLIKEIKGGLRLQQLKQQKVNF